MSTETGRQDGAARAVHADGSATATSSFSASCASHGWRSRLRERSATRNWRHGVPPDLPPDGSDNNAQRGIEFGWRVHSAQESWTAKVDGKASLLLALQGGALFGIATGHQKDGFLAKLTGWHLA